MNYDIFFISYNESNQEANWQRVLELHPTAKRLHGITGIDTVHNACNSLSTTEWFWTVDGDNWLIEELAWEPADYVDLLLFHANDPLTNSITKLGGVKLWRKNSLINTDMSKGDFCLNATKEKLSPMKVFSFTNYNNTPYEAWKTSFRHCVKLMSVVFQKRPLAESINHYLEKWQSCKDLDNGTNNAQWAYRGYCDAREYVLMYDNKLDELFKINDYAWLVNYFKEKYNE